MANICDIFCRASDTPYETDTEDRANDIENNGYAKLIPYTF